MEEKSIKDMFDIYKVCVENEDKKGYSELFKTNTQECFKYIEDKLKIKITDIKYLDGYFLFGRGTNSVIHFKINKCPGWLFGIWWETPEDNTKEVIGIKASFFTQYEEILDKFKPYASRIRSDFIYNLNVDSFTQHEIDLYDIIDQIKFIINEPYLAFYRDYTGQDYNTKYITRFKAWREFIKFKSYNNVEKFITKYLDNKVIKYVNKYILPMFNNAELLDMGENAFQRYEVCACLKDNLNEFEKIGHYYWFSNDEVDKALEKRYHEFITRCTRISNIFKIIWYSPISEHITIIDK